MSNMVLSKLDSIVKSGYKSRSDCVKSLIDEKYAQYSTNEELRNAVKEIINTDEEIKAHLMSIVDEVLSARENK